MTLNIRYLFLFALTFLYICFLSTIGHSAEEQLKHVNFKVAKDVIQTYIIDAASNANKDFIGDNIAFRLKFIDEITNETIKFKKMNKKLADNTEIKIFFDDELKTEFIKLQSDIWSNFAVGSIVAKYKDENGSIGWKFDVVFEFKGHYIGLESLKIKPILFVNPIELNNNTISEK